jgi:hypothetical protein
MDEELRAKLNQAYETVRLAWCLSDDDIEELFINRGCDSAKFMAIKRNWGFFEAMMAVPECERLILMEFAYEHFRTYEKEV